MAAGHPHATYRNSPPWMAGVLLEMPILPHLSGTQNISCAGFTHGTYVLHQGWVYQKHWSEMRDSGSVGAILFNPYDY